MSDRYAVIARGGLKLRGNPMPDAMVLRTLAEGTVVNVLMLEGNWAQVDLEGDGRADGFVSFSFLRPADGGAGDAPGSLLGDITGLVTPAMVKQMFPAGTRLQNITANLPFVLAGLRARRLGDRAMVLMALGTIRAETEGFVPIDEGRSQYNTRNSPFDLYDAGTPKGVKLGNTIPGDGPRFKGRGYIQLTGRDNYNRIGAQVGANLIEQPALANEPTIAGLILAQFLKNKDSAIRRALAEGDLRTARWLVNGGEHGLDRFTDTFNKGMQILPS